MKRQLRNAGYGFVIDSMSRNRLTNKKCELDISYYSDSTSELATFTYEFASKGLFKRLTKYKEIENKLINFRMCEAIAFIINSSNYGVMRRFNGESLERDFLDNIPNSLILNDEAMRELLVHLNPGNKHLVVYVGDYIQKIRKQIEEEQQADLEANKETYDKYDQLKEEFKF